MINRIEQMGDARKALATDKQREVFADYLLGFLVGFPSDEDYTRYLESSAEAARRLAPDLRAKRPVSGKDAAAGSDK